MKKREASLVLGLIYQSNVDQKLVSFKLFFSLKINILIYKDYYRNMQGSLVNDVKFDLRFK